jgi:AraC family transcriptional activator of pobA
MKPYKFDSIAELHRLLELPKPEHPLVSVINFEEIKCFSEERLRSVSYNFYCIAMKKNFQGKMKYGQNFYDFDEGVMTFFSPGQVVTTDITDDLQLSGWWLVVHPEYIRGYPLGKRIKEYGYFSYAVNEALHLSVKEEMTIENLMKSIMHEYRSNIDNFSQDVIISQIELLLNFCNRFYSRQFITRKTAGKDLLIQIEELLSVYLDTPHKTGLPTVKYLADKLNVSPGYLTDMLNSLTGQNTQQHIHNMIIEKAKETLTTTSLPVSTIAYQLGFEYPQSFHKLFKNKTSLSPLEFRKSFN